MLEFSEIYLILDRYTSVASFTKKECKAYYDQLILLPPFSNVVEIGVQYGRSTIISASVAKEHSLNLTAIDNWSEDGEKAKAMVDKWMKELKLSFTLLNKTSLSARIDYHSPIDLLFIDGNHTYQGVTDDCMYWIPLVKLNGIVCFHDFGRESLPDVYRAFNDWHFNSHIKLEQIDQVGSLGIFTRYI